MNERPASEFTTAAMVNLLVYRVSFPPARCCRAIDLDETHGELQAFGAYLCWASSLWIGSLQGQLLGRLSRCSHAALQAPRSLHLVTLCLHRHEIPLWHFNRGPRIFLVHGVLASPSFNHAGLTYRKRKRAEISPLSGRTALRSQG